MPKMLTVDEEFEAIVADVAPEAKAVPYQEPSPVNPVPVEGDPEKAVPAEAAPSEEKPAQEK
ncbi:hypothetical protein [Nocardiopsis synnemataformans]|uniref:hypothetical protein n=1 Tax=Nocardiopsis synnemataformans TaxID=61305 RepID=UPI003EBC8CB5